MHRAKTKIFIDPVLIRIVNAATATAAASEWENVEERIKTQHTQQKQQQQNA